MPCPKADVLEISIAGYKVIGADTIVSLLPLDEMAELGVARAPQLCRDHGVQFLSHPIADFGLPQEAPFIAFICQIATLLRTGHGVAVHCRAGIGRSGMTTAGTLIALLGMSSDAAIAQVEHARGVAIPDTVEQGAFIARLAKTLKSGDV